MARVTVEDCFKKNTNSFEFVFAAAQRARQLSSGAVSRVDAKGKPTGLALREIAPGGITKDEMFKRLS